MHRYGPNDSNSIDNAKTNNSKTALRWKESSGKPKFVLVIGMIGTMQRQIIQKFSGGGEGIFR